MATLEERKLEYNTHKENGYDYYNTFRSQLTLDVESGNKTILQAIEIQQRLVPVTDMLMLGDWKSAHNSLCCILSNVHCTADMLAGIKSDIESYISTNYSW